MTNHQERMISIQNHINTWALLAKHSSAKHFRGAIDSFASAINRSTRNHGYLTASDLAGMEMPTGIYKEQDALMSNLASLNRRGWILDHNGALHMSTPPLPDLPQPRTKGRYRSRSKISPRTRREIFQRDGWACWLCGYKAHDLDGYPDMEVGDWYPTLDHIELHHLGGSNKADNLRTAHWYCNMLRGSNDDVSLTIIAARVVLKVRAQEEAIRLIPEDPQHAWRLACSSFSGGNILNRFRDSLRGSGSPAFIGTWVGE